MLILKDKTGTVVCEAQNITETYNAITAFAGNSNSIMSITIESDRENGITLNSIVEAFTKADLSEISVFTPEGELIEQFTEYPQLTTVCKSLMNGGMTIDVTLSAALFEE